MSLRVTIVALSGFLVTFLIAFDAYKRKKQFYPTVVYLANHQPFLAYYNLLFSLIIILVRYIMHSVDTMREHPWDKKAMYLLYVEIVVGILRLFLYIEFTTIMWKLHPFPLFVARPIYLSVRTLKKAIRDVYMSRRAIRYLNTIFRNATAADLAASSDTVCIICREEMQVAAEDVSAPAGPAAPPTSTLKRLPCSHIFHTNCLLSWFQRQQTCPTCRMHVLRQPVTAQNPAAAAAAPASGSASSAPSPPAGGSGEAGQAAAAGPSLPADARPPWMLPGMPPPFFTYPPAPANQSAAGQPVQGQQAPSPYMFPQMHMMPPYMGIPMIYPGNLFPPPTSPMPVPPTDLPEGMSEAQLRASTLARFTALRQVNVLLQAAVLQMNAYLSSVTEPTSLSPATGLATLDPDASAAATTAAVSGENVGESVGSEAVDLGGTRGKENEGNLPPGLDRPPSYGGETSDASAPESSQPGTSIEKDSCALREGWLKRIESQKKDAEEVPTIVS